ncbi:MAG: LysR family transcriptional regulator [Pseudomonadales bacterium]
MSTRGSSNTSWPAYHLDWNLVRTFIAVVESGSLAAAGRRLTLAHPTVARHVQTLEEQLGLQLFDRTGSGLKLNSHGEQLAEVANRMRQDALAFEAASDTLKNAETGTVRVTIAELMAECVPALLAGLPACAGPTPCHVELMLTGEQLNLLQSEADFAVRHVRPQQADLVCRRVGALRLGAWASSTYLERWGTPAIDTLSRHWFIDGVSNRRFCRAAQRLGIEIPAERVVFRSDSMLTQRNAALAGRGIVGLPLYMGDPEPQLARVLTGGGPDPVAEVWLVARPGALQMRLLRDLFEQLGEALVRFLECQPGTGRGVPVAAVGR